MYHFLFYNISHSKTLSFAGVINVEVISKYSLVTEAEFYITLHSTFYISIHSNILCCFASYQCQSKEFVKNQCDYKDHLQRKQKEKKRSQLKVHLKTDSFSRLICSNNLSPLPSFHFLPGKFSPVSGQGCPISIICSIFEFVW